MSTSPRILAVCVNWNGRAVLPAALASLRAGGVDPPLIVVDNASTDGSPDWVDLSASRSRLLRLAENRGYGAAVNEAIRRRPTLFPEEPPPDWFLVFNNDVTFSPSALAGLIPFAESTGPGIYGPKIVRWDRPDLLEAAWGRITWGCALAHWVGVGSPAERWIETTRVPLLLGCALLIHRGVFERCGLFDEEYFLYHEEIDLAYRAARAGFPVYFRPDAVVRHRSGHSSGGDTLFRTYWTRRNTIVFLRKHRPGPGKWGRFLGSAAGSVLWNLLHRRFRRTGVILRGYRDGFAWRRPADPGEDRDEPDDVPHGDGSSGRE